MTSDEVSDFRPAHQGFQMSAKYQHNALYTPHHKWNITEHASRVLCSYTHIQKPEGKPILTQIDCGCSKILSHGLNHGFFFHFLSLYPAPYIELYVC